MFRYQDNDNYYRFSWTDDSRRLEKRVAGDNQLLAQDTAIYNDRQTYTVQIIAHGSMLKILIDAKTIFSITDSTFSDGSIALSPFQDAQRNFHHVAVEELPSGKPLLSETFKNPHLVGWTVIDDGDPLGRYAVFTRGSWQDYRLTLKARAADSGITDVLFRVQDTNNYYRLTWGAGSNGRRLVKRETGVERVIAQDSSPYVPGKNYEVEIVVQRESLQVRIDGKSIFSVTDRSFKLGTIGFYSDARKGSVIDDVVVDDLSSKALLLSDDFNNGAFIGWSVSDQPAETSNNPPWSVLRGELVQNGNHAAFLLY
jgi:hypothetical protein